FGGTADREVSRDQLWAWRVQTRSGFSLCMLPGDHFFLFSARQALLQALCRDLAVVLRSRREIL
ncbi:MAG TPA: hypothetical protein VGA61_16465, partial [Anaerolineae bacterium]